MKVMRAVPMMAIPRRVAGESRKRAERPPLSSGSIACATTHGRCRKKGTTSDWAGSRLTARSNASANAWRAEMGSLRWGATVGATLFGRSGAMQRHDGE